MTTSGNLLQNYFSRLYIPRITWTDIIEIIIIAVVLYNILLWIMNTKAWALLKGIIVVGLFAVVAYLLNLKTILWIAGKTISVGIIALVIIFQPELRRALEQLGRKKFVLNFLNFGDNSNKDERFSVKTADEIVDACYRMGAVRTGASISCINSPPKATETLPVSSDTIIVILSVASLIPTPARCLVPKALLRLTLSVRGR